MSSVYVSKELCRRVAQDAGHRCGYCLSSEVVTGTPLTIEHLIPHSLGGPTERLFNPREQVWREHFAWDDSGIRILGKTDIGGATVEALRLNRPVVMDARRVWVAAGLHPPKTS